MSLQGWTLPQTPTGAAALMTAPPWHYSGEIIACDFRAAPAVAVALMPAGLVADGDGGGAFVFANWSSASDRDPRVAADPARGQYKEAFCLLHARLGAEAVARVPYIWVDNDLSLVRGLIQGFPKKAGAIYMTQPVEVGRGGAHKRPGHTFRAHVAALNRRLATLTVAIEQFEPPGFIPAFWSRPLIHTRLWPAIEGTTPAVHEFQRGAVTNVECGRVCSGRAELHFEASEFEELSDLAPIEVGTGYVHALGFSLTGGAVWPVPVA